LVIVAVSDLHLGFSNSDKPAFVRFLENLLSDSSVTDLVLLGDIVDMWRRDSSGVFLENHDVLDLMLELQKKTKVYYVAGNHDFHVLKLQGREYPFNFLEDLTLQQGDTNCRFVHGWQFDDMQRPHFMESLCHSMSDHKGDRDSNIWAALGRYDGYLTRVFYWVDRGKRRKHAELLQLPPEERLIDSLNGVEKKARSSVQAKEILVFGHTHRPFINNAENLVNVGSWVTTVPVHNTFLRLEEGKPRLFVFEGTEITDRADI